VPARRMILIGMKVPTRMELLVGMKVLARKEEFARWK
jgi:hypothetical protein